MKINIEDYLQQIDSSFKEKSQKDIYMTYIMAFALIFAFSYLLFWDTSEADFNTTRDKVVSMQTNIANDKMYLQQNPLTKITAIEVATKKAHAKMLEYKENNKYIRTKIEEISALVYDKQTWGEYLHSISKHAKTYDIKILDFTNKYMQNNSSFGHVLDITISSSGSYKNTLKFINALEESELVVDLHSLDIIATEKLKTDLNISVWGITY